MPRPTGVNVAWLTQWWTLLATLVVVFVPGLVAAWSLGFRRLAAWAFAPVGSVAMVGLLATVFGFVRIPWTLPSVLLGLVVLAALLVACRVLFRIPDRRPRVRGTRWPVAAALVVAAVLLAVRVGVYIGDPSNISQTNDAAFHLGAVRAIIEQANASSFGLAGLIDPAARGAFYPGAWHATDSVVSLLTGDIAVSTNMLAMAFSAIVWPLGITWLTQTIFRNRVASAAAAAMSPVFVIFPLEMIQYGVLYAYFLAVALLPAALAAVIALTSRWSGVAGGPVRGRVAALVLALGMGALALALAQTSVIGAWGLLLWLYAAGAVLDRWRRGWPGSWWNIAALLVGLVALSGVWFVLGRLVTANTWRAWRSGGEALWEILSAGFVKTPPAWWVAILLVVGLVAVLRRAGARWTAFGWAVLAFLAFVAYAVRNELIRVLLVGPWYSDPYRLAALVPIMMIPVAAAGVLLIVDQLTLWSLRRRRAAAERPRVRPRTLQTRFGTGAVAALLVIGIIAVAVQPLVLRFKIQDDFAESESPYWVTDNAWLDRDERALLSRIADEVEPGAVVLGNPGTGAALGYFFSGVDVFPAKWPVPNDPAYTLLKTDLREAATDPVVCDAVRALGAQYVLDFGEGDVGPGVVQKMPGFTDLDGVPGFELVDSEGEAKLWRITACA